MKKHFFALLLSIGSITASIGQATAPYELFGNYADLDGTLLHEYADQDYSPKKALKFSYNSLQEYTPGAYYTGDNKAKEGLILYADGNYYFNFKVSTSAEKQRVEPSPGWSFMVGADSFVVADGFTVYGKLGVVRKFAEAPQVLRFLGESDNYVFFSYTPIGGTLNYLAYDRKAQQLSSLPIAARGFQEKASEVFAGYPDLVALIKERRIGYEEMASLIRYVQYTDAVASGKPIGYTVNWEGTRYAAKQTYHALVSKGQHSWQLDFYNKAGQKLFTEHYALAEPTKHHGEALWYFNDFGAVRKKTTYTMGEGNKDFTVYHRNGQVHYSYDLGVDGMVRYRQVLSEDGKDILDASGSGKEEFTDLLSNRRIVREFERNQLKASYYTDKQNRTVYQYAKRNARIQMLKAMNTTLTNYATYPKAAIRAGEEGVVLVRVLLDPNGNIEETSLLRGISERLNNEALGYLAGQFQDLSFKGGKHGKEAIYQEIVVPVQFSLNRPSMNRYYYNHQNLFWMQHMQHMHHMNMQHIPTAPPSMPR